MGFGSSMQNSPSEGTAGTNSKQQVYFKFGPENIIRVLDEEEVVYWRYYMWVNVGGKQQERSIVVGRSGPIRDYFSTLDDKDPKKRRPGKRMLLNILDRTPVKKLDDGSVVVYPTQGLDGFPKAGPNGENLANVPVEPNNQVYILDAGPDIMGKLATYHRRARNNKTFEPMNIWDFDVRVVSIPGKEAKDVQRTVMPDADQEPLSADLKNNLLKYDLTQVIHIMPDDAQRRILAGEDLLDILRELNWSQPQATVKL